MEYNALIELLNADTADKRLSALSDIKKKIDSGEIASPQKTDNVNNHIHTTYSFSPYSPTKAVYMAYMNGLVTAGIMDHDSIGGAKEFIEAGKIFDIATTVGIEARVDISKTKIYQKGRKVNNPDMDSVIYVALHGVPHQNIDMVNGYFAPFRKHRNIRNMKMCENITNLIKHLGISLDFERDVLPLSQYHDTGSVTERHVLFALAKILCEKYQAPKDILEFFKTEMKLNISEKIEKLVLDCDPRYYLYDILGILKSDFVEKFYIAPYDECPNIEDYIKLAKATGSIAAYPYLGDVGESVTGDKRPEKFEDDYLDLLFDELKFLGFNAVTYMPTRNTKAQLERLIGLCEKNNLFQVSGEDINSPRQSFICKALEDPMFKHLIKSTWALIGHETAATEDESNSMFSEKTIKRYPDIKDRVEYYYKLGAPK